MSGGKLLMDTFSALRDNEITYQTFECFHNFLGMFCILRGRSNLSQKVLEATSNRWVVLYHRMVFQPRREDGQNSALGW